MVVASISQHLFRDFAYTIRHGLAAGMKRRGGLGFIPFEPAESPECSFLRRLPLENKVVYDIGAFEGILALFFARKAKQVIAYEPNPRNFARCMENVRLNDLKNVRVLNRGVSDRSGTINLTYDPLMPGAGSGEMAIANQISSSIKGSHSLEIPIVPLDDDIRLNQLPAPDLIKIDIEGMELPALKGMRRTLRERHPDLFIEMHGATPKEKVEIAEAVLELLETCGYRAFDVERGQYVTRNSLGNHRPGHLYCN